MKLGKGWLASNASGTLAKVIFPALYKIFKNKEFVSAAFYRDEKIDIRNAIEALRKGMLYVPKEDKKNSLKFAGLDHASILIAGHTHDDVIEANYCNSGSWITRKPSYLTIYPNGLIELYRWVSEDDATGYAFKRASRSVNGEVRIYELFGMYREKYGQKFGDAKFPKDGMDVNLMTRI